MPASAIQKGVKVAKEFKKLLLINAQEYCKNFSEREKCYGVNEEWGWKAGHIFLHLNCTDCINFCHAFFTFLPGLGRERKWKRN